MIRIAFAIFLALHGFAHGVGFAGSWQLGDFRDTPLDTTLLARRVDVGVLGIRIVGVLWLLTGLSFVVAAVGVGRNSGWWPVATAGAALVSLAMSILGLPEARIGIAINVLILAGLALMGLLR